MPATAQAPPAPALDEAALQGFLAAAGGPATPTLRTLARAWRAAGQPVQVGKRTVRLLASDAAGRAFTAATLHASHPARAGPALELSQALLRAHGVGAAAWQAWCDERPELRGHGFVPDAPFPVVGLDRLPDPAAARLAMGLRDLALLLRQRQT